MPREHLEWLQRIKAVERESSGARFAMSRTLKQVQDDPSILEGDVRPRDIRDADTRLEGTYMIRLFAEFETGLRLFWSHKNNTNPRTRDLLEGIVARCGIPRDDADNVHAVREFRNALVHEREDEADEVPIAEARHYLCQFFGFLWKDWSVHSAVGRSHCGLRFTKATKLRSAMPTGWNSLAA